MVQSENLYFRKDVMFACRYGHKGGIYTFGRKKALLRESTIYIYAKTRGAHRFREVNGFHSLP